MSFHKFLLFISAGTTGLRSRSNITIQLEEEEDVYDLVEEDQYAKMVEERRNSNNFVVDDSKFKTIRIAKFS